MSLTSAEITEITEAAVSVDKSFKQYRALVKVGEVLGRISNLASLAQEFEKRVDRLRSETEVAATQRHEAVRDLTEAKSECDGAMQLNKKLVADGKNRASQLIADAKEHSAVLRDTARTDAMGMKAKSDAEWEERTVSLTILVAKRNSVQTELDQLTADLAALKAKF